jgi:phospholipid/cholesterol/gamma-HCH transport system ATP-binding protein
LASSPPSSSSAKRKGENEAHLVVDHVERRFDERVALSDVTLSFQPGEVAVIIGGSGAGKTTLLKILIALDKPTSGAVILDGVDIAKLSERELNTVRRSSAWCFSTRRCSIR